MATSVPGHVCVAIGVSAPENLDVLPGALSAVDRIVSWGETQGYATLAITDDPNRTGAATHPVTIDRVCAEILPFINNDTDEHIRIIIAFAGHGSIAGTRDLWLLNGWYTGANEIIDVELMRRRLATYQYNQITIVSDACRTVLPNDDPTLQGSRVFPRSPWKPSVPEYDILLATGLGKPAYMVRPSPKKPAHCLFTEVVATALEGGFEDSVDNAHPAGVVVSSQSLKRSVRAQIQVQASDYNQTQVADINTNFSPPDDVYTRFPLGAPAAALPPLDPKYEARPTLGFELATTTVWRGGARPSPRDLSSAVSLNRSEKVANVTLELQAAQPSRAAPRIAGVTLRVSGDHVLSIASPPGVGGTIETSGDTFQGCRLDGSLPSTVAVQLAGTGQWALVVNYPGLVSTLTVSNTGVRSLVFAPLEEPYLDPSPTIAAIAALEAGAFVGAASIDLAAGLRLGKHADPVRGVLAAYLYAREGAIESVRRIAWFYSHVGQPVPFDVALIAGLPMRREAGKLIVSIAATKSRAPLTALEAALEFTTEETEEAEADVAGNAPWLRQGWALLEDSTVPNASALLMLKRGLTPAVFSTFDPDFGSDFARLLTKGLL